MTTYKIQIQKSSYIITDNYTCQQIDISLNPTEHKLFNNDVFTYDTVTNQVNIISSPLRTTNYLIPGVLILKNNKTYGRNKTNNKLMYKCISYDKQIPVFLVPYEIKNIGFSKILHNLYVIINYVNWNNKHPHGVIIQTIGEIHNLSNFYEYQLCCKNLNISIKQFTKDTITITKQHNNDMVFNNIIKTYPNIEDRTNTQKWGIFTIDPPKSTDFDDGFSIIELEDGIIQLSIYISNVSILLDILNLWDVFSNRITTIYLPDKKIPMLPTILSDGLCSLQENKTRITLVMDLFIKDNVVINTTYSNCIIKVKKNYVYEEPELLCSHNYKKLFQITQKLSMKYKYINNVSNSHDLVSYFMIFMNYTCATEMIKHNNGIFRTTTYNKEKVPENISKHVNYYGNVSGKYLYYGEILQHHSLNLEAYIHITSPIRRLVDLLNSIQFQKNNNIILSDNAYTFFNKWVNELEYINTTMRSVRKVQNDCYLLNLYVNTPETITKLYDGYIFEINVRDDGLYKFIVYLPELKITTSFKLNNNLELYTKHTFKLYLFNDEDTLNKKVRLQIVKPI